MHFSQIRYCFYFFFVQVKPKWRLEDLFVVEQHQKALEFDQTPRHPMTVTVKTPEDILNMIDYITYNKAAAILRMLKYIVGDGNFQQPLDIYLQTFKYVILWNTTNTISYGRNNISACI